jgi:hypothetical protein
MPFALPINENDAVATEEIRFGDNDTLGALVANLVEACCELTPAHLLLPTLPALFALLKMP